jgi:hypothetical protein
MKLKKHTWKLVNLQTKSRPLDHTWSLKKKIKIDGIIDKYKKKLVKGFKQFFFFYYFDIYSSCQE